MKVNEYITRITEYTKVSDLNDDDSNLITLASNSAKRAYAPYSNFNVGACVLLANGEFFEGNNQENAAYPSGLCAERVAIFYAQAKYPNVPVIKIAIVAFTENGAIKLPISPCGACLQVLLESELRQKTPIKLILSGSEKTYTIDSISELMPLHFKNSDLNK